MEKSDVDVTLSVAGEQAMQWRLLLSEDDAALISDEIGAIIDEYRGKYYEE